MAGLLLDESLPREMNPYRRSESLSSCQPRRSEDWISRTPPVSDGLYVSIGSDLSLISESGASTSCNLRAGITHKCCQHRHHSDIHKLSLPPSASNVLRHSSCYPKVDQDEPRSCPTRRDLQTDLCVDQLLLGPAYQPAHPRTCTYSRVFKPNQ